MERLAAIQPRLAPHPPSNRTQTSRDAAYYMRERADSIRARVYAYIKDQGEFGATREEMEFALGYSGDTLRPRVWELERAGRVVDSGARRRTSSGRPAMVMVVPSSHAVQ